MQLTENFNLEEWRCKDGTPVPDNLVCNVQKLAENLQVLRDYLGEPIRLNSGYRTPAYNRKIGGAPKSQHTLGKAADITVKSKTPKQLKAVIEKLIKEGKMHNGGVGLYSGFIHYDVRPQPSRW
jgi:uncharacterized protein YcbK (DUF882 family)